MHKNILLNTTDTQLQNIASKRLNQERLSQAEGIYLFEHAPLAWLGALANTIREQLHGNHTYFNRNFHIEPTNVCVFSCNFCSYSKLYAHKEEGWELTVEQMLAIVKKYDNQPVTEVHIVGGVHPKMNLDFFCTLLTQIKEHRPDLHIKGFTAVELDYMFRKAKLTTKEGLEKLKAAGLQSLPGGGAEIFAPEIRGQISADKIDGAGWLAIHQQAHLLGMHSNATMLYGHIENYSHRIAHMDALRKLQDETNGFNTFIPLKFRNKDMRMYAVARIFIDNIKHLKAYWPMLGRQNAQLTLSFGVNDVDGTIDDTTKIYSMAGSEEQNPVMTTEELVLLIEQANRVAIERDTLYNTIKQYN
jgi:aminodeoxyfutalosine synthase